jgi:hypothetical protein
MLGNNSRPEIGRSPLIDGYIVCLERLEAPIEIDLTLKLHQIPKTVTTLVESTKVPLGMDY